MTPERWARIEEIYHGALDRDSGARQAFVQEACLGDEELQREVQSLLAQASGDLLNEPVPNFAYGIAPSNGKPGSSRSLIGEQLGVYKILAKIGEGGMGVVYRARDTKLGRDVAIKVLPPGLVNDAERLARFRREAKLLASLNHPNIATIHGMEDSGGMHFLAMELVEGKTLAERARGGRVPLKEALGIARQIAEALEHAHQRKVIHRDLKPANVVLTTGGRVKVLDFGLAKAFSDEAADSVETPTLSMMPTEAGRIMGTPAYMSPEQAEGKPVDQQTDIWAFGCLLYELLAGRRAFDGENVTQTLAAVLHNEPDWQLLPANMPSTVRTLLRRCLQKEPSRRAHSAADLAIEIEESLMAPSAVTPVVANTVPVSASQRWKIWGAALVVLVISIAAVLYWRSRPSGIAAPLPVARFVIPLTEQELLRPSAMAISPDGTRLVIGATSGAGGQMYMRTLDNMSTQALSGTEDATFPFFSPDSQWIGFFANGKLKKVSVSGGAPIELCDAPSPRGGNWGDNGTIVFSPSARGQGIFQISENGGKPTPITTLDTKRGETSHRLPFLLPGGKAVLFAAYGSTYDDVNIIAQSLQTGARKVLIEKANQPRYVATGHLIYTQPQLPATLIAVPFDPNDLTLSGPPVPVIKDVLAYRADQAIWGFSKQGTLFYPPGGLREETRILTWVDRKGNAQPLSLPAKAYDSPRISPDGKRIAYQIVANVNSVWIYDLTTNANARLTFDGNNSWPQWTPDGKHIIYDSNRSEAWDMYRKSSDGNGQEEVLWADPGIQNATSVSPDGKNLTFLSVSPTTLFDIWIMPLNGQQKPYPWLQTPAMEDDAKFSPDGKWMAYVSNESGRREVYIRPFPGPGEKRGISVDGGTEPVWAHSGRELFFRNGEKIMAVNIVTDPVFQAGTPHLLFSGPYLLSGVSFTNYDVTADDQRFLMVQPSAEEQAPLQLNVVLNWFEELKQKVPASR